MQTRRFVRAPLLAAGACSVALLALAPAVSLATEPAERSELEKELSQARAELDKAAREVAELSRQLYGGESGDVMRFVHGGPQGSMLGINIGSGAARDDGVEVMGVSPGGPAEQAGLKTGDVLVAVDGKSLRRSGERTANAQLVEFMRGVQPGSVVKVEYLRDGKRRNASVTTAPAEPPIVRVIRERLAGPQEGDHQHEVGIGLDVEEGAQRRNRAAPHRDRQGPHPRCAAEAHRLGLVTRVL